MEDDLVTKIDVLYESNILTRQLLQDKFEYLNHMEKRLNLNEMEVWNLERKMNQLEKKEA